MKTSKEIQEIKMLLRKIDGLQLIFPMLSSDAVGEAGNAAKIITAKLKQESLDWHHVVDVLFQDDSYKENSYARGSRPLWKVVERTGNYFAHVNGFKCTIFRSKKYENTWDAVVNTEEGPVFFNGFSDVTEAQEKIYSEFL